MVIYKEKLWQNTGLCDVCVHHKKKFAAVGRLSKIRGGHLLENKASLPREKYEKRNRKKERKFDQEKGGIEKNTKGTKKRQTRKLFASGRKGKYNCFSKEGNKAFGSLHKMPTFSLHVMTILGENIETG